MGYWGVYSLTLPLTASGWTLSERTLTLILFLTDVAKLAPFEPRNVCRERQVLEAEAVNIAEVVINLSDI